MLRVQGVSQSNPLKREIKHTLQSLLTIIRIKSALLRLTKSNKMRGYPFLQLDLLLALFSGDRLPSSVLGVRLSPAALWCFASVSRS